MSDMASDIHRLTSDDIPILERLEKFLSEVRNLGCDPHVIHSGNLDEHLLSHAFKIPPQVVRMYFDFYLCDEEERRFIAERRLDTGLVRTLMLIEPEVRKEVYRHLDELLKEEYPVSSIIDFIDEGSWRTRIRDIYDTVERNYWAAVSSYLKDTDTINGTITKSFRSLLMKIKTWDATDRQLAWLERAIIHDSELNLGIFSAQSLREEYPAAIEAIEKWLADYKHFDAGESPREEP